MALSGHLSDLSLSELIEFFCNQRKTGRLKVLYPQGPGYFYLNSGSVVDARIGELRGIDAVYYALTLPNAKFEFSGSVEMTDRSINQPWTQVVLEGLRRLDEGIEPPDAFPSTYKPSEEDNQEDPASVVTIIDVPPQRPFLSFLQTETISRRKPLVLGAVGVAILASVAVIGVPAGWYKKPQAAVAASQPQTEAPPAPQPATSTEPTVTPEVAESDTHVTDDAATAARKQRDRDKARAREERTGTVKPTINPGVPTVGEMAKSSGPKRVTVTVTYDETGRVTQASGADATAIRIARQKRFPAGKAGSATVTIPIN